MIRDMIVLPVVTVLLTVFALIGQRGPTSPTRPLRTDPRLPSERSVGGCVHRGTFAASHGGRNLAPCAAPRAVRAPRRAHRAPARAAYP